MLGVRELTVLRFSRRAMACEFEITASAEDRNYTAETVNMALDEIERLDNLLSCFNPASEISFLNAEAANRPVVVDPDVFRLLRLARQVWEDTDGAFDITAGPLIELWRKAEREGIEPDKQAIDTALSKVGMSHVLLDETDNSVRFSIEGVSINPGAIGKGFAVGCAAEILREYGIKSALITAGKSTISAVGSDPDGSGWKIGIRHPSRFDDRVGVVTLRDNSMSTSGGVVQRDEVVEEKFEHIIDPVSGLPAQPSAASVSVTAPDPALSDALSTAFYLRGKGLAQSYCRRHPGIEAVFVEPHGPEFAVCRVHAG